MKMRGSHDQPKAVHVLMPQPTVVELLTAENGMRKVSCTKTLQAHCGLGLAAAKDITDALLDQQYPTVSLPSAAAARALVVELAASGVVARFAEGPDYDPQERLASALSSVQSVLSPEVLRSCESLSAHGEWELAVSRALAGLPQGDDANATPEFIMLSELAVEFGILQGR
ncbi:hypothetical protein [Rhizobacter sp. P5_C2]